MRVLRRLLPIPFGLAAAIAVASLGTVGTPKGYCGKPIIILYPDNIEPVASLSPNGRHVEVVLTGQATEWKGQTADTQVIVTQESTGAVAVGLLRSVPVQSDPLEAKHFVNAHVVAGSPPFEEGIAEVTYFEEIQFRGKVIDSWSKSAEVLLVQDEP